MRARSATVRRGARAGRDRRRRRPPV